MIYNAVVVRLVPKIRSHYPLSDQEYEACTETGVPLSSYPDEGAQLYFPAK